MDIYDGAYWTEMDETGKPALCNGTLKWG